MCPLVVIGSNKCDTDRLVYFKMSNCVKLQVQFCTFCGAKNEKNNEGISLNRVLIFVPHLYTYLYLLNLYQISPGTFPGNFPCVVQLDSWTRNIILLLMITLVGSVAATNVNIKVVAGFALDFVHGALPAVQEQTLLRLQTNKLYLYPLDVLLGPNENIVYYT